MSLPFVFLATVSYVLLIRACVVTVGHIPLITTTWRMWAIVRREWH